MILFLNVLILSVLLADKFKRVTYELWLALINAFLNWIFTIRM